MPRQGAPVDEGNEVATLGVRPRAGRRVRAASMATARGAVGFVIVGAMLEVASRTELVNPAFLPPATEILLRTVELLLSPEFLGHVGSTLWAWALGLGAAALVAVPVGVVLGSSNAVYQATRALIEFLRPIPSVALIPLAILLFGRGTEMKVSLIVYASVWPILFNTIYGMHDVEPLAKDTARSFGFGRVAILARVALPSAAPFIFTGLRVASAIALILAVSAELIGGGSSGLGTWIQVVQAGGTRPDLVFAGTVVAGLLGWLINVGTVSLERRFFGWQPALRGQR